MHEHAAERASLEHVPVTKAEHKEASSTSSNEAPQENKGSTGRRPLKRASVVTLALIREQWLLLGIALVIVISSQVQVATSQQSLKSDVVAYLCVAIIFLITGCTLDVNAFLKSILRWKVHLYVQSQCFLVTSALVFGIVSLLALNRSLLSPGLLIGMIFMGCMATTISSNVVMTSQAKGNSALTVTQTSLGNLIGAFVSPALVVMYTSAHTWYNAAIPAGALHWGQVYSRVLQRLGLSLYLPLCVGQALQWYFPRACDKVFKQWKLAKLGSVSLLILLWQTLDTAFAEGAFETLSGKSLATIILICVAIYCIFQIWALASSVWWLNGPDVVSVSYCVTGKGLAVGVPLARAIFADVDPKLQAIILVPMAILQCVQMVGGALLVVPFRRWIERGQAKGSDEGAHDA